MAIAIKRVYDAPARGDGRRILVDRLWPRGISKEKAKLHAWVKEVAPSNDLRKWYHHDPAKWDEFRRRYFAELDSDPAAVEALRAEMTGAKVTFLFSSREAERNNAAALREYMESKE